jgi:hypothetical protein
MRKRRAFHQRGRKKPSNMKTSVHVSTSAMLAAAVYAYSRSVPEAACCLVSGVLIDLDHVVDFHLFSGERFTLANFFSWCNESRWQKITLIFHSYELFGILCVVAFYLDSAVLRGILWGAGLHLLLDQLANPGRVRLSPWFYLLGYRIAKGFRRDKMELSPEPGKSNQG